MKELSELEKDFLQDLLELSTSTHNMFFGNLVDKYLPNIDISLDRQNKQVEYLFDRQVFIDSDPDNLAFKVRELSWKFMILVKLLKYLEENNYLYLYQETLKENNSRFGQLIRGNESISSSLNDPEITELLLEYSSRTIIIGQPLIKYIKNDFTTDEQIRHNENLDIAKNSLSKAEEGVNQSKRSVQIATWAIIVSVFLGVIGVASSFYIAKQQTNKETTFNQDQLNKLTEQLKSINDQVSQVDSTIKAIALPDTLNTRITNENPFDTRVINKVELKKAGDK